MPKAPPTSSVTTRSLSRREVEAAASCRACTPALCEAQRSVSRPLAAS